jgi:FKBP-type peptidyl-prolyl cis-trans isomerase (trigger factor)
MAYDPDYTAADARRDEYEEKLSEKLTELVDAVIDERWRDANTEDQEEAMSMDDYRKAMKKLREELEEEFREEAEESFGGPCCNDFHCPCGNSNNFRGF